MEAERTITISLELTEEEAIQLHSLARYSKVNTLMGSLCDIFERYNIGHRSVTFWVTDYSIIRYDADYQIDLDGEVSYD